MTRSGVGTLTCSVDMVPESLKYVCGIKYKVKSSYDGYPSSRQSS